MDGLTHYTGSLQAIVGILSNGFAWVPNRRNLMSKLVPGLDFSKREPQQFGMISFTDWTPPVPKRHRERFGDYGIMVSLEWARAEKQLRGFHPENVKEELRAQRVIYLEDGPCLDALRWLYMKAFEDLHIDREQDNSGWLSAVSPVINKAMAKAEGHALWASLLTLYEFLEDGEHAFQSEWRIVHPLPAFGYSQTTREVIAAVSPPQGWAKVTDFRVLTPPEEAITAFVCPRKEEPTLRRALPSQLSDRPIVLV
jgi:hypothetical protein